jgi:hypothetical protein
MNTTLSVRASVATLGVAALLLTGCGSKDATTSAPASAAPSTPADNGVSALTADQIMDRAKAAVKAAKSFSIKGTEIDDGEKSTMAFAVAGKELDGTIAMGTAKVEVLAVGGEQFLKANQAFWVVASGDAKSASTVAKLIGDRWVKVPADNKDFSQLFDVTDIDEMLAPDGTVSKGAAAVVDGVPTIAVIDGGKPGGTLTVDTVGEPYPVKLTRGDGSLITFSGFGEASPALTKPAADQVIDLSALGA